MYQTALGLQYLHDEGIVHAKLWAVSFSTMNSLHGADRVFVLCQHNVLVDDDGNAALTDLCLSILETPSGSDLNPSISRMPNPNWRAPELLEPIYGFFKPGMRPTKESDVYSFGCFCLQVRCISAFYVRLDTLTVCINSFPDFHRTYQCIRG